MAEATADTGIDSGETIKITGFIKSPSNTSPVDCEIDGVITGGTEAEGPPVMTPQRRRAHAGTAAAEASTAVESGDKVKFVGLLTLGGVTQDASFEGIITTEVEAGGELPPIATPQA